MFVLFFILRPLINFIMTKDRIEDVGERKLPAAAVPARLEAAGISMDMEELEDEGLKEIDAVKKLAGRDARKFAELLRNWLR
jgi:flagellar biosynthesis/type III secretory pathway M-ring protein FliF/YscJ